MSTRNEDIRRQLGFGLIHWNPHDEAGTSNGAPFPAGGEHAPAPRGRVEGTPCAALELAAGGIPAVTES